MLVKDLKKVSQSFTIEVEAGLPADPLGEKAGHWQADDGTGVGAAEGQRRQSTALHRRCPVAPDAVTGGVRHALQEEEM